MNGDRRHALGSHAEALARSGVDCRGAVCRWSADLSAVFFPRLPVGLYFLGRDSGGMLGAAHAASSRGRTMGLYDPAGVGSGDSNSAADGAVVYSACCSACRIFIPGREPKSLRPIRCCNRKPPISIFLSSLRARCSISPCGSSWDACSSPGRCNRTAPPTTALTLRLQRLSGPGLVLYGLTVSFAAIDWMMSLEPKWYSTIFGMIFMVSFGLAALALAILATRFLETEKPLARVVSPDRWHDLGNLLLALVMFWAYLNFSQFLLIWSENLAEEIPWYLHRIGGGWEWVAIALILFQFALPFVLLLSRNTKRNSQHTGGRSLRRSFSCIGWIFSGWWRRPFTRRDFTSTGWISWRRWPSAVFGSPHSLAI